MTRHILQNRGRTVFLLQTVQTLSNPNSRLLARLHPSPSSLQLLKHINIRKAPNSAPALARSSFPRTIIARRTIYSLSRSCSLRTTLLHVIRSQRAL